MTPIVRWVLSIVVVCALLSAVVGIGMAGLIAVAFASDSCEAASGEPGMTIMMLSPVMMGLGVIVAGVSAGLGKPAKACLKWLAIGVALGIAGYASWGILLTTRC
ncbi:MAG: hypothetical protein H3C58_05605 [Fimbriimonadaceae bacterium]|nr:hypothetical protein [Fimbriimonadaceae bacterium]